jgi:hypothetical protein
MGRNLASFTDAGNPFPALPATDEEALLMQQHRNVDKAALSQLAHEYIGQFNEEQTAVFDRIKVVLDEGEPNQYGPVERGERPSNVFFLDAPGGAGKTHLLKAILSYVRGTMGKIAIASATTGIAATLLPIGQTAHSAFGIPTNINETQDGTSGVRAGSARYKILQGHCLHLLCDINRA